MYPICVECLQTAFYTDWVHLRVIVPIIFAATFMYPICVECLQSAFYTDWVQETISKNAKITFSQKYTQSVQKACTQVYASILHRLGIQSFLAFFEDVPNLCRMLAHRYMQAFYTDWVHKIDPHTFSTQIGYILKNVPNLCRMLAHNFLQGSRFASLQTNMGRLLLFRLTVHSLLKYNRIHNWIFFPFIFSKNLWNLFDDF